VERATKRQLNEPPEVPQAGRVRATPVCGGYS
jgi:hypothetical protein